jgi:hypothetical protein
MWLQLGKLKPRGDRGSHPSERWGRVVAKASPGAELVLAPNWSFPRLEPRKRRGFLDDGVDT